MYAYACRNQKPALPDAELSVPLRTELVLFMYREALERVPFFCGKDPLFIADVVSRLKLQYFSPVSEGRVGDHWVLLLPPVAALGRGKWLLDLGVVH